MVVGYMGVPYMNTDMTSHPQYVTVRNERGAQMLDLVRPRLEITPTSASGNRQQFVLQTVVADDEAKLGRAPKPLPKWLGSILAAVLLKLGPTGLEFGRYSIDYHFIRNFLYVQRHMGAKRAEQHVPQFAKRLVAMYDTDGAVSKRLEISPGSPSPSEASLGQQMSSVALAVAGATFALVAWWLISQ